MNIQYKTIPLEERVSGDELLNAKDLIEEIKHSARVDENGYVTVFHRTSTDNALNILRTGVMSSKEDGIFFSSRYEGVASGYGEAVIEFKIPIEKLVLDDVFDNEVHLKIPLKNSSEVLDVSKYLLKIRLFLDLDGTAAVFKKVDTLEILYEKGYFANLEPNWNVINAIKIIINEYPQIEVFSLSAYLSDSKYALSEKNQWMNKYLPEIDEEHRIFMPCGENKLDYIPGGVRETDTLMDDYTHNLTLWEPPARGIKLLNGINHTRETWRGNRLRYDKSPEELAENIVDVVLNGEIIRDIKPQETDIEKLINQMEKNFNNLSNLNKTLVKKVEMLEKKTEKQGKQNIKKNDWPNLPKSEGGIPPFLEQNDIKPKM